MNFTREPDFEYTEATAVLYTKENGEKVTGKYVFRKRNEKVQVLVVKEIPAPDYATSAKPIIQRMQDFSEGLRGVTMETRIRSTDEYGYDDPSATIVLKGWKEKLSNRENRALENAKIWF